MERIIITTILRWLDKGEEFMDNIEITVEYYDYYCGDGSCSEHGGDVIYEVDGIEVGRDRLPDFDSATVESTLTALGYEVDGNYNDMGDSYVITAVRVRDFD